MRPRNFFKRPWRALASSRFSRTLLLGLVFTRRLGVIMALSINAARRSSAISLFRAWLRDSCSKKGDRFILGASRRK
jgi:hypothetical protein